MARHKTSGSAKKLIVAGCLVERYRDEIMKSIPEVDAVVGTGELEAILEAAGLRIIARARSHSPFNISHQQCMPSPPMVGESRAGNA
jgi:ribosomal protein S12 methylthiotransferase